MTHPLKWEKYGFEKYHMVVLKSPADGHCFLHSVFNAFYKPYRTGMYGDNKISRRYIVEKARRELSNMLDQTSEEDPDGRTYYETINNGALVEMAKDNKRYSLKRMKESLASDDHIGLEFIPFISDVLNKDIYFLENNPKRKDVYILDEAPSGDRDSIVLLFNGDHYDLVGLNQNDGIITHFTPRHPYILFLRERILTLKKNGGRRDHPE